MPDKPDEIEVLQSNIERALDRLHGDNPPPMDYALAHATLLHAQATAMLADKVDDIRWLMS